MSTSWLDDWRSFAVETAEQAGKLLMTRFDSTVEISKKGQINLVTEMDLKSEELITDRISARFPGHAILAEEGGAQGGDAEFTWIVDPLDGTTNYAHGYRFFSVSIALRRDAEIVLGVVYDPVTDEMYSAVRGGGALCNGRPIRVSTERLLSESLLCTGFPYAQERILVNLEWFNRFMIESRAVRRDGSAALDLAYLAAGRFDGFWELDLNPWDVAAGILLVTEAGGTVTRFDGSRWSLGDPDILASNGGIHEQMSRILQSA